MKQGKMPRSFLAALLKTLIRYAHEVLTDFMSRNGFTVTPHFSGLETAWKAEFTYGRGGRVFGINSEMDALPGIGHGYVLDYLTAKPPFCCTGEIQFHFRAIEMSFPEPTTNPSLGAVTT